MHTSRRTKILFVCMGNICRSPSAHALFRHLVQQAGLMERVEIDSAGTHADYHLGAPPDSRARASLKQRWGLTADDLRARKVRTEDIAYYDHILVMDAENYNDLCALAPAELIPKIQLFLDYAPHLMQREVPDPYYGGLAGFEQMLDLLEAAAQGLLETVQRRQP